MVLVIPLLVDGGVYIVLIASGDTISGAIHGVYTWWCIHGGVYIVIPLVVIPLVVLQMVCIDGVSVERVSRWWCIHSG